MNGIVNDIAVVALTLAALPFFCQAHRLQAQVTYPSLELRDSVRILLPEKLDITGAAMVGAGRLVYWSAPERALYVRGPERVQEVCQEFQPMAIAAALVDSHVEVVDALDRQLLRLDANGRCNIAGKLAMNQVSAAVWSNRHWVLIGIDSQSRVGWFRIDPSKSTIPALMREQSRSDLLTFQYSAGRDAVIATQIHWPFRWTEIASNGADSLAAQPFVVDTILSNGTNAIPASRLLALPTIKLEPGYLEQLADATSDLRVFVLFDQNGVRTRVTLVDTPIGFLSSDPDRHALLGLLTSNVRELVVYSWHWLFPEFNHN